MVYGTKVPFQGSVISSDHRRRRSTRQSRAMSQPKLPPDVEFLKDIRLLIHRPKGVLNEAIVNRLISAIGDLEAVSREPFNRFADTLGAEEADLNFRYIMHVSLYRRLSYAGRPPVKTAILATDATIVHYANLHAMLTQGSSINARVFRDREQVAKWLNVSI